jgi:hypothetical protein
MGESPTVPQFLPDGSYRRHMQEYRDAKPPIVGVVEL